MYLLDSAIELFRQTIATLWRNKTRSFLTMFGIAWGIASLVLMSALCDGFRQGQRKNMEQLGSSFVMIFGGRTEKQAGGQRAGWNIYLQGSDLEALREQCPAVAVVGGEIKRYGVSVSSDFNSGQFLNVGVTPDYLKLRNLPVENGRQVSQTDVDEVRRVCVLGSQVRKQLFEERPQVIGQRVRINGHPYQVIGLMGEKNQNSSYDGWDNDKVLIPATSLRRDCPPNREAFTEGRLEAILYRPADLREWKQARHQVKIVLGNIKGFDPEDESALYFWDTVEDAELFDKVFDSTEIFLALISLVTMSLGGVGIMNTMMMSVSERTNEIGLKKALGATRRRILLDFFTEGLLLALLSGGSGLALTWLFTSAVNSLPMPAMFSGLPIVFNTFLGALLALATVAILSAIPPAWRASSLTPVEALRYER
jgi:putative ABC transport system permease protein